MDDRLQRLLTALTVLDLYKTPARIASGLRDGVAPVREHWRQLTSAAREAIAEEAEELLSREVDVVLVGDASYPHQLRRLPKPPSMLFMWGNQELLHWPGVGMCGSRNVSEAGLRAAEACGTEVARNKLTIISGYARGVDTETHLAALKWGGRTVIVLAEGISGFRVKRVFKDTLTPENVLVVSQFPPRQRWNAGAAMARNGIIAALGQALIVIEAGETGGTLNAGMQALEVGIPVMALEFSESTPEGNRVLHRHGARPLRTTAHLKVELDAIADKQGPAPSVQMTFEQAASG